MALLTDRKFIHFNKKSDFEAQLNANAISDKQIVFLKDAQEIWTHGTYYGSVEQFLDETNKDSTNAISAAAVYKALTDDEKTIAAALNDLNDRIENLDIPSKVSDLTDDLLLATQDYVNDRLDDVLGISAEGVEAFVNMTRDEDTATGILTEITNKAPKTNAVNGAPLSNTESYFYGTSTTAAATAQKEVSIPSITSLKTGQIIVVKPTITSTVANSTIKLNNFTAYPMRYNNAAITISTNSVVWNASFPSIWVFDGNYWVFLGHGFDNNTTYYAMSQGEATTGTATTARIISAKVLNDTIEGHTKLSSSYQPSSLENDDLILDGGDTYETAFGKLEKSINDNEQITAAALTDLDSRINTLHLPQSLDDIPDGSTRKLSNYATTTQLATKQDALVSGTNIKTINNQSLLGSGNITIQGGSGGDTNVIETVKVNGTALTPDANKAVDITSVPGSIVTQDATHRFVSDADKTKLDNAISGVSVNGSAATVSNRIAAINISGLTEYVTITGSSPSYGATKTYAEIVAMINEGKDVILVYQSGPMMYDYYHLYWYASSSGSIMFSNNGRSNYFKITDADVITNGTLSNVTSVTVNGDAVTVTNGVAAITAVTAETQLSTASTGTGSVVTGLTVNNHEITMQKGNVTLDNVADGTTRKLSNYATTGTVNTLNNTVTAHTGNSDIHVTAAEKTQWNNAISGVSFNGATATVNNHVAAITATIPAAPGTLTTTATTAQSTATNEALSGNIALHKVSKTGSYSDLTNKPTIPTVNNATLTIQKNGTTVNTFTANASSDVTANIQVNELPTVSSSDNGKVLQVVNGVWSLVMPTAIYTGSSTPSNSLGNDGDIYVQS